MAKVLEFGGSTVVTDLTVKTDEGEFTGAAMKGSRYSYDSMEVTVETPANLSDPLRAYAEKVLEAAAVYELALHAAKKKLVEQVRMAQERLAEARKPVESVPTPLALPEGQ
jgi:hypothetical protein